MRQKKSLLAVLGTLTFACLFSAVAFMPKTATSAETEKITVENVLMEEGATVRVSGEGALTEKTGIRFNMYIDKATFDANTVEGVAPEVGMFVALTDDLTGSKNLTSLEGIQAIKDAKNFLGLAYMQEGVVTSDDTANEVLEFRVVNELPVALYGKAITANGYIKIGEDYIFSTNPQSRSIAQISDIALDAGAENDDLTAFVNGALTADNFGFAVGAEYTTDGYKNFDLGAEIPADLTADWASSDENVVTVENGVLTRVGEGTATISATIGSTVRETTITVNKPNELIVDNTTNYRAFWYDGWSMGCTYKVGSTLGFSGDYKGDAVEVPFWNASNYFLMQSYTAEELQAIAKDYNTVTIWMAVDNMASGYIALLDKAVEGDTLLGGNPSLIPADNKVWKAYKMTMSQYISIARATCPLGSHISCQKDDVVRYFHPWAEATAVEGTSIKLYFGNVEFSLELNPYVSKITESTWTNVSNPDIGDRAFVSAEELATIGIQGEYKGNATKIKRQIHNSYRVANPYSLEDLAIYKKQYDIVTAWLAIDAVTGGTVRFYAEGENGGAPDTFLNKAGIAGWDNKFIVANPTASNHLPSATWMKITISIDDYIDLVTTAEGKASPYCPFMAAGQWESAGGAYFYIGDIEFGVNNDAVRITDSTSAYNYYLDQWNACTFVSAANLKANGLTGDYNGNATRIKMYSTTYKFKNFFTAETIKEKAKKFNTVSVWITSSKVTGGSAYLMGSASNTFMTYALKGVNKPLNNSNSTQWVKYSISMDNFIALLEANNYAEYCPLVNTWPSGVTVPEGETAYFYFGDMFFENV